jgi:hypothetical protein
MGGLGSSRWGRYTSHPLVEEVAWALDISRCRELLSQPDAVSKTSLSGLGARITVSAVGQSDGTFVVHIHRADPTRRGHSQEIGDGVRVEAVRQRLGGMRWWFRCPSCRRRCGKLYLTPRQTHFGCRRCRGLKYRSQRLQRADRIEWKMAKIEMRLGARSDLSSGDRPPPRPRGMHRRTYARWQSQWWALAGDYTHVVFSEIERRFDRAANLPAGRAGLLNGRPG